MNSRTQMNTSEAQRISKRLLNHWKHKFEVAETETQHQIFMPTATITLSFDAQHLNALIESQEDDLSHLEQVVLSHLNRMAGQEFQVEWTHD